MGTVHDVAAAIIRDAGPIDQLCLEKLLYYSQGWSLAWNGEPLFPEPIEAWKHGPVVDAVFQVYKHHGFKADIAEPEAGDAEALTAEQRSTVRAVLQRYGHHDGPALRALTHEDAAWADAWNARGAADRGRQVIDPDQIVRSLLTANSGAGSVAVSEEDLAAALEGDGDALARLFESA